LERAGDWPAFLADGLADEPLERIRSHMRTGRALGTPAFRERLEKLTSAPFAAKTARTAAEKRRCGTK